MHKTALKGAAVILVVVGGFTALGMLLSPQVVILTVGAIAISPVLYMLCLTVGRLVNLATRHRKDANR